MTLISAPSDRETLRVWAHSWPFSNLRVFCGIHSDEIILKSERLWTKARSHPYISKPDSDFEAEVIGIPV